MTTSDKKLSQTLFETLREKILGGSYPSGARLPSEREMVKLYGVNRGAVREALQRLSQAGLVSIQHGGGTRVLDFRLNGGLELLTSLALSKKMHLNLSAIRGMIEMRTALAKDVARLAAQRRTEQQNRAIREYYQALATETDVVVFKYGALRLWDMLIVASDNLAYQLAFNTLKSTYQRLEKLMMAIVSLSHLDEEVELYTNLVDAIDQQRPDDAEKAARFIVEADAEVLMGLLEQWT